MYIVTRNIIHLQGILSIHIHNMPKRSEQAKQAKQAKRTQKKQVHKPVVVRRTSQRPKKITVLAKGWSIYTKQRKRGKSKGNEDKYYTSPKGKRFRSQTTMRRHIDDTTPVSALCSNSPAPLYQKWTKADHGGGWLKEGPLFK